MTDTISHFAEGLFGLPKISLQLTKCDNLNKGPIPRANKIRENCPPIYIGYIGH